MLTKARELYKRLPKLEWVSLEEGTRAKDEMVDRAATYLNGSFPQQMATRVGVVTT